MLAYWSTVCPSAAEAVLLIVRGLEIWEPDSDDSEYEDDRPRRKKSSRKGKGKPSKDLAAQTAQAAAMFPGQIVDMPVGEIPTALLQFWKSEKARVEPVN